MMAESFVVSSDGAHLKGDVAGQGSPLVCLHAGVADRRMWWGQMAVLGQTIAYDRRGFGTTECEDHSFSHVEDLAAVLDHLQISKVNLCGCSQGGRIAVDFALAHPERVTSLILIGSAISGAKVDWENHSPEIADRLAKAEEAEAAGDLDALNELEAAIWLDGPAQPQGRVHGPLRNLFLDMNGIALRHPELTKEAAPPSAWERLGEIKVPTLVLCGEFDFPWMITISEHIAQSISGAQHLVVKDAAHLPSFEKAPEFNPIAAEFLVRNT